MKLDPEERILLDDDQIKKIDEICETPSEISENLKKFIGEMNNAYPFKRVSAPKHLIDRWNEEIGKKEGKQITEMALTIDKDAEIDDDDFWKMMTYTATKMHGEHNPPKTGIEKKTLL